jgi:hypothetical protein
MMVKQQVQKSLVGLLTTAGLSLALFGCNDRSSIRSSKNLPRNGSKNIIKKLFSNRLMAAPVPKPVQ